MACTGLKLLNSLSKTKETFTPLKGKKVKWYCCGPTVYDASHMGHARSYITFDILRRVLTEYFNYDVLYVMNITDIDDKIIKRARQNYLVECYRSESHTYGEVKEDLLKALKGYSERAELETDKDKKTMMQSTLAKAKEAMETTESLSTPDMGTLIEAAFDPLAKWLDQKFGATVTEHKIFAALTTHWEEEFHKDMEALNVHPPDVLTRVSEYVPEIVAFVEKIIENGYGYESNGSIYFNTLKFSSTPDHRYAKLVPEAVGDMQALAEGEGELSVSADQLQEKKHPNDFALWKASKPGEPAWPSPWGPGRPGWHIECSVMACAILGSQADIHTGGVDLKFPHHDNEIAQAEAYYESDQWMSFFLHAGHLTIEGCKMSKSLKNFVTIKDALKKYTPQQLRLAFLHHMWNATLDFSDKSMQSIIQIEKTFNEFFLTVKDLVLKTPNGVAAYHKWNDKEKELNEKFFEKRREIHEALCDSVDTPTVMHLMQELVKQTNIYMSSVAQPNAKLAGSIADYLSFLFQVFGVVKKERSIGFNVFEGSKFDQEKLLMPYLTTLADFRNKIREAARKKVPKASEILQLCDWLRDDALVELGVKLEDKAGKSVVKLVGKEALLKERKQNL